MKRIALFALLACIALAGRAEAALTHQQHASSSNDTDANTTVVTAAFGAALTGGNTYAIECSIFWEGASITVTGVNQGGSNVLSSAGNLTTNATYGFRGEMWRMLAPTGGSTTGFTATFSSGPTAALMNCAEINGGGSVLQFTGTPTGSPQDSPGTGANAVSSGNITTTADGCYIHGATGDYIYEAATINIGTDVAWTGAGSADTLRNRQEYYIQPTAAAISAKFNNTSASTSNVTLVSATCPSGGGGGPTNGGGLGTIGVGD